MTGTAPAGPGTGSGTDLPDLLFVMSFRSSLTKWRETGMLDREVALLNGFMDAGLYRTILIVSYDPADRDLLRAAQADGSIRRGIDLLLPDRKPGSALSAFLYSLRSHSRWRARLGTRPVIRSNQISGAWTAILAQWRSGAPFVLRCGYSLSKRFALQGKPVRSRLALLVERIGLWACEVCFVSSLDVRDHYARWKHADAIVLTPTFVDTVVFRPARPLDFAAPVLFVGRLEPQKNVEALIAGCGEVGLALDIVGDGSLRTELEALAARLGVRARFLGTVPNTSLADLYRAHAVYALPSHHDPMPKTLIEAMASGLVCVSTPTKGGQELLVDGRSGYMARGFAARDVAEALRRAMGERRMDVGDAAREHVVRNNSFESYLQREATIVMALVRRFYG